MNSIFRDIHFETSGDVETLKSSMDRLIANGAKSLLILSCDNHILPAQIDSYLKSVPVPVFGGIFPKIVFNEKVCDQGFVIAGLNVTTRITVINENCSKPDLTTKLKDIVLDDGHSLFIFADGLMKNIDPLLSGLYEVITPQTTAIGAGCSLQSFKQKPCLFTNNGLIEKALSIITLPAKIEVSSAHGWHIIAGPFLVTESEGNIIRKLNHLPAFQVYKDTIKQNTGVNIEKYDFYHMAKSYPLGFDQLDEEVIVRDPVNIDQDSLVCVGSVPANSSIYILHGDPKNIIHAAGKAVLSLMGRINSKSKSTFIMFDCISRALFLEDKINHELDLVYRAIPDSAHLISAMSLGEISLNRNSNIHFHNKSIVLGCVD